MSLQLPPELQSAMQPFLVAGRYTDETELLRDALAALSREREVAEIQLGLDDVAAGRYRPFEEIDAEIRKKFGFKGP
ncbi:ribbon-helix-helix domain-containing protein [Lacipirellula sp.]|uniref:ribbon-helix-helix domain-containing protein n=1 Tax=Lacipirellula sp. TaxID=2691419 RepID=UPI003D0CA82C